MTPSRDCAQSTRTKTYNTRGQTPLQRSPQFNNVKRITVMPVIFANGDLGRPLFVIEGKAIKYRTINLNGASVMETIADFLPRGSVITTRGARGGGGQRKFPALGEIFCGRRARPYREWEEGTTHFRWLSKPYEIPSSTYSQKSGDCGVRIACAHQWYDPAIRCRSFRSF